MIQRLRLPKLAKLLSITVLLCSFTMLASAQRTVSGKVTDAETRSPMGGVSVIAKGSNKGTATDADGNF